MTIEHTDRTIEVDQFRAVLRRLAAPVVVVTVDADLPLGFTAASFASVSVNPPRVSVNADRGASTWPALATAGHIGVHLLGAHQEELARRFATTGIDRFAGTAWHRGPHRVPLLDDAPAWLVARIVERFPAGDHAIILAEPVLGEHLPEPHAPLVYHLTRYRGIT